MIFFVTVNQADVAAVQQALVAQLGSRLTSASPDPSNIGTVSATTLLDIDVSDPAVTSDEISAIVTNASGNYADVSEQTGPGTPTGTTNGPNMGAFLNTWGAALKKFFQSLLPTSLAWLWWILAGLVLLLIFLVFFTEFSKGLGEGIATRA